MSWHRSVVAALALAACKDAAPPAAPPPAPVAGPRVIQLEQPRDLAMVEPEVEVPKLESFQLLDAGASGERVALRYQLATGTRSFFASTTLSSRHLEHGAFTAPIQLPAIRDGFALTVDAPRGSLALRALPGEAAATTPEAAAYLASWRQLENRRATIAVDDRGQLTTVRLNDDPSGARSMPARNDLVQRLLATIVPLPVEPIGAGARWRVTTILKQGPAYAKQTATYTLIARGATRWKVHVALQRVAETQRVVDPALPPGTSAELVAMFRALEGDVDVDPAQPLITGGALTIESRLHVKLTAAGQAADQASDQIFEDTGRVVLSTSP